MYFQDTRKSFAQGIGSHINLITGHTQHDGSGFALGNVLGAPPIFNFTDDDGNVDRETLYDAFMLFLGGRENKEELFQVTKHYFWVHG